MRADRLSPALYAAGFAFALCVAAEGCEHKRPPQDTRGVVPLWQWVPDAGAPSDADELDCDAYVCASDLGGEMSCFVRDVPAACYTDERNAAKCARYLDSGDLHAYRECLNLRRAERDRRYWREHSSW